MILILTGVIFCSNKVKSFASLKKKSRMGTDVKFPIFRSYDYMCKAYKKNVKIDVWVSCLLWFH